MIVSFILGFSAGVSFYFANLIELLQLHGLPLDRNVPKNHDIMANHSSATIREVTPVNKTESR